MPDPTHNKHSHRPRRKQNIPRTVQLRDHDALHRRIADPHTPIINSFFEKATGTWQYVLVDPASSQAVIIDTVLDYDPASGAVSTKSADDLLQFVEQQGLHIVRILCVLLIYATLHRLLTRSQRDACACRPPHGFPIPQGATRG